MIPRRTNTTLPTKLAMLTADVERYVLVYGTLPDQNHARAGSETNAFRLSCQSPGPKFERFRSRWKELGEALVVAWSAQQPGTRPYGWWLVSAPELRAQVGGSGSPSAAEAPDYRISAAKRRGVPLFDDVDNDNPPLVESEAAYLRRLGLLLPGEARAVLDTAYEPETVDASAA